MENLFIFIFLLALGYILGTVAESNHYRSIKERERKFSSLPAVTIKNVLDEGEEPVKVWLVSGSVVVSLDYFKKILAGLKCFVGGEIGSYETLIDRARREAVLRMKEEARGADVVANIRIETSSIGRSANSKQGIGSIEVLAYGTAFVLKK